MPARGGRRVHLAAFRRPRLHRIRHRLAGRSHAHRTAAELAGAGDRRQDRRFDGNDRTGPNVLQSAYPYQYLPATIAEAQAANQNIKLDAEYRQLVNVVILATLPIAGCSLAVSVAAGLSDRKRPFSLLRLTGAPLSMLRRVVGLESAVPLIVISVIAIAIGFLTAGLFLDSQLKESLQAPGSGYYLAVLGGLALCLAIIASTLPLLDRITGPETARND